MVCIKKNPTHSRHNRRVSSNSAWQSAPSCNAWTNSSASTRPHSLCTASQSCNVQHSSPRCANKDPIWTSASGTKHIPSSTGCGCDRYRQAGAGASGRAGGRVPTLVRDRTLEDRLSTALCTKKWDPSILLGGTMTTRSTLAGALAHTRVPARTARRSTRRTSPKKCDHVRWLRSMHTFIRGRCRTCS